MSDVVRHVMIHGRVQGVGFRYWTTCEAIKLGLTGWVRNRRDGRVEAIIGGSSIVVDEAIREIGIGPAGSRVESLQAESLHLKPQEQNQLRYGFSILPTE